VVRIEKLEASPARAVYQQQCTEKSEYSQQLTADTMQNAEG